MNTFEQDMNAALIASLQDVNAYQLDVFESVHKVIEDEELQKAISLSLQENNPKSNTDDDERLALELYCKLNGPAAPVDTPTAPVAQDSSRSTIAEATQRRYDSSGITRNPEKNKILNDERKRQELIGIAEALYHAKGRVPPFGLRSLSIEALQRIITRLRLS